MDLVEEYNLLLKREENQTIRVLNDALDRSFNRVVRRVRVWLRTENAPRAERDIAVLNELRSLVPAANPNRVDKYDRIFRKLMQSSSTKGIDVSDALVGKMAGNRPRIDVAVPLEASVAAARQSKGYLRRHGEKFAETTAQIVSSGITEGRSNDGIIKDMRDRLGVVKSRAEVIVRTESLRAYNDASNLYYATNGIDLVLYYATRDDRACGICAPRGGKVYKRSEIRVPIHPRCRCYLAPWDPELANIDPDYRAAGERHQKEMEEVITIEPTNLSRAGVFEQLAPRPVALN